MNEKIQNGTMNEIQDEEMNEAELENVAGGYVINKYTFRAALRHYIIGKIERRVGFDVNGNNIIGW